MTWPTVADDCCCCVASFWDLEGLGSYIILHFYMSFGLPSSFSYIWTSLFDTFSGGKRYTVYEIEMAEVSPPPVVRQSHFWTLGAIKVGPL